MEQNHLLFQFLISFCSWFHRYISESLSVGSTESPFDVPNTSYRIVDGKDGERYLMEVMNVLNVLKQQNIW